MGILNRLFASTGSLSKRARQEEAAVLKSWAQYKDTFPEKERLISQLPYQFGQRRTSWQRLQRLLKLELVDIHAEEKEQAELLADIRALEHAQKISRVQRLEHSLAYVETKYKYVYELLRHLYAILTSEADLLKKVMIVSDLSPYRKVVSNLKAELAVEKILLEKIGAIETFSRLLLDLVRGEQVIQTLNSKEKKLVKMFRKGSPVGGVTDKLILDVFEGLDDKIHEAVAAGLLEYHQAVDLEYVNGAGFVDVVKEAVQRVRGRALSEPLLTAFIHLFREKYNQER
jgi:hypothetical protein